MEYCSCGVKHKFASGVIFLEDRNNYGWNCLKPEENVQKVVKNYKIESKINSALLIYE